MASKPNDPGMLRFLAGRLCLDFVNSIENRAGKSPDDFLTSYPDLVRWGQYRDLLTEHDARRLLTQAVQHPRLAADALNDALTLRETLHRVFLGLAQGGEPTSGDLEHIQRSFGDAITHGRLHRSGDRFGWDWPIGVVDLNRLVWPIAHSAVELLIGGEHERIKVCANPDGCGWLFYDNSKNGSRRWCSMEGCGSQVKMRRQYAKRRTLGTGIRDSGLPD